MTKTSRKTSRKPHAETTKDPRFNGIADCVGIPQRFALPKAFQTTNFGIASFVSLRCHPKQFALPKAFQLNASRLVGFFNTR